MKKNFLTITTSVVTAIIVVGCSSDEIKIKESDVPKDVLSAFRTKYPSAQAVEWEAEKEDGKFYFEAEWKESGKEKEVHITPDGSSVVEE